MKVFYDFHIHSALSPCGDADNTPNNIVNMAKLKGLDMIAVSDHNSMKNVRAAMLAGESAGLVVLPAMELTTAEDVHLLCLFADLERALEFAEIVDERRMKIQNKVSVFGEQQILDEQDNAVGTEPYLLTVSSNIPLIEAAELVRSFGGAPVPAHVDKQANSVLETLGALPEEGKFTAIELSKHAPEGFFSRHTEWKDLRVLENSDAHYLWDISEAEHCLELEAATPQAVINFLSI